MENLRAIRNELLKLHKSLMEIERMNYEEEFGKLTPSQLLQLLFESERFTWLRTISILVTEFDEMFADRKGIDSNLSAALLEKTQQIFDESDTFPEFKPKYKANLDTESSISAHHLRISTLLQKNEA